MKHKHKGQCHHEWMVPSWLFRFVSLRLSLKKAIVIKVPYFFQTCVLKVSKVTRACHTRQLLHYIVVYVSWRVCVCCWICGGIELYNEILHNKNTILQACYRGTFFVANSVLYLTVLALPVFKQTQERFVDVIPACGMTVMAIVLFSAGSKNRYGNTSESFASI